jgi:hypothetical protein
VRDLPVRADRPVAVAVVAAEEEEEAVAAEAEAAVDEPRFNI